MEIARKDYNAETKPFQGTERKEENHQQQQQQ